MQFIVEDGTGVIGATSYASVEAADDYAEFWDFTEWELLDLEQKEKCLIKATLYLDSNLSYPKRILTTDQGLNYPREPFTDLNGRLVEGVPEAIEEATVRIAILLNKGLNLNKSRKVLTQQSYGSSSESYLGGYSESADDLDLELASILRLLGTLGLGGKGMKVVKLERG